jgi:hypothetical protein
VDLLKGVAWPAAALIGGAVVLKRYDEEIRDLIPRIQEAIGWKFGPRPPNEEQAQVGSAIAASNAAALANPKVVLHSPTVEKGASIAISGNPQAGSSPVAVGGDASSAGALTDPTQIVLKDLPGLGRTPAIADLERLLHAALNQGDDSNEDRIDRLVRLLAEARIATEFERIYRIIFGSQIRGLRILNQEGAIPIADARQRFNAVIKDFPDFYNSNSFDSWINFLIEVALVAKDNKDMLILTPLGKDFLHFLTQRGYSENRPY